MTRNQTVSEGSAQGLAREPLEFFTRLSEALAPLVDAEDIQSAAAQLLCETLQADRAYYTEIDEDAGTYAVHRDFVRHDIPAMPRSGRIDDHPEAAQTLRANQPYVIRGPKTADDVCEQQALGIGAVISVPLIKDGRLVAAFSAAQVSARDWTAQEVQLLRQTADRTWSAVLRARAETALQAELDVTRRLCELSAPLRGGESMQSLLNRVLDHLVAIHKADFGNVQLCEADKTLRMVAHRGFAPQFIEHFEVVTPGSVGAACGRALFIGHRVVYSDVEKEPDFAPCLPMARAAGFRAVQATPLRGLDGRIIGMICTHFRQPRTFSQRELMLTDLFAAQAAQIIERKHADETLRDADRHKDEFLATLAHELRNPLAPIRNGLEIARLASQHDPHLIKVLDMMSRQMTHMVRLVDDLLDVGRIQSGKLELQMKPLSLAEAIARSVESLRPALDAQNHRLQVSVEGEMIVNGDMHRLTQVFSNILANAAKYSAKGGSIRISAARENGEGVVWISDSGIGIPPGDLNRVFDMFSQVRSRQNHAEGGLGIGLSLVRKLVNLHGGSVHAESEGIRKGSTFIVRLPLVDGASAAVEMPDAPTPESVRPGWRILVVDDNADAAASLAMLLQLDGHETEVAHDGLDAIEQCKIFEPHAVILDIGMPRMDGYECARRLRKTHEGENAVIIALTGYGQPVDKQRSRAAGFDHHLVKPIEPAVVSQLIAQRLDLPVRTQ